MIRRLLRLVLAAALPLAMIGPLRADVIFTLDAPVFFGAPGTTFDITGSLSNSDTDPVFLNTASGVLSSGELDFDYANFFVLVPRVLNPGDLYSSSPIFSVIASPEAQPGDYSGSFTILGGVDENAFDELATQNFQVSVTDTSAVPEPSSVLLLGTGIAGLLALRRRGFDPQWTPVKRPDEKPGGNEGNGTDGSFSVFRPCRHSRR